MRLALSSSAFERMLTSGELTQLEFLDRCATELGVDGAVLDVAHFPRDDVEYLAQVKKFAADLGLTLVAVRDDALALEDESRALELADKVGAPYVLTRMPQAGIDPVRMYNDALTVFVRSVAEAKRRNVTLAVRNVPGSLADDGFEMSRLRKEADSGWLRFALDVVALRSAPIDAKIRSRTVLAYHDADEIAADGRDPAAPAILQALGGFVGFLCLDYQGAEAERSAVSRLVTGWKTARAEHELQVAEPHVPS